MTNRLSIEQLRRGEFVDATVRTIAERGFHAVTIRDIARAAGASPASVLYYFKSKDELLEVAFSESDQRFRSRMQDELRTLHGAAKLLKLFDLCFPDDPNESPVWKIEIDLWSRATQRDEFRAVYEAANAEWIQFLTAVVEAGVASGEFRLPQTARDTAIALAALIDGLAVHNRVTRHISIDDARRVLRQQFDAIYVERPAAPQPA